MPYLVDGLINQKRLIEVMLGLLAANNIIAGSMCSYSYLDNNLVISLLYVIWYYLKD